MTLIELQTDVRVLLSDNPADTSQYRISTIVLNIWLNQAQQQFNILTEAVRAVLSITSVADQAAYAYPTTLFKPLEVSADIDDDDIYEPLGPATIAELNNYSKTWRDEGSTSNPDLYYLDHESAKIGIFPPPDAAVTDGIKVWGVIIPTDMAAGTSQPFNSITYLVPFHHILKHYAIAQGFLMEKNHELYTLHINIFNNLCQAAKQSLATLLPEKIWRSKIPGNTRGPHFIKLPGNYPRV